VAVVAAAAVVVAEIDPVTSEAQMTPVANHRRLEVVLPKAAAEFHRLPTTVRDILRLCDGKRSLDVICACSPIAADQTTHVLRRLVALGMIAVNEPAGRPRRALTERTRSWISGEADPEPSRVPLCAVEEEEPPALPLPATKPRTAIDFTDEEETFFSRSIEHLLDEI